MNNILCDNIYKSLKKEEVICIPTDTIWGFVCLASSNRAVQQVYQLKNRSYRKPLALLVNNLEMAESYVRLDQNSRKLLNLEYSVSVIAPAKLPLQCARHVNIKNQNLAIRIPKNPFLKNLISNIGAALVATSANLSGNMTNKVELYKLYQNKLTIYELSAYSQSKEPSAIIDCTNNKAKIIRASKTQKDLLQDIINV